MFHQNIKLLALENDNFRNVIYTGNQMQVVLMNIMVGSEIGEEVHGDTDQIIVVVEGEGETTINGKSAPIGKNDLVYVPAGAKHNFRNKGMENLKLYTIYSPVHHPDKLVEKLKP